MLNKTLKKVLTQIEINDNIKKSLKCDRLKQKLTIKSIKEKLVFEN